MSNQKDLIILNQVAAHSHISTCQQYCMVAGSGLRADTTSCRVLCEASGSFQKFSGALSLDGGLASPDDICAKMFIKDDDEDVVAVSLIQTGIQTRQTSQKNLGVRGDMTVQGTLATSLLTSPIGDVKVTGELNVMNEISATSAQAAFINVRDVLSLKSGFKPKKGQLLVKGKIDAESVVAGSFSAAFLEIEGVRQWSLVSLEDFEEVSIDGWSHGEVTECGGHKLLGGHCVQQSGGKTEISKTFSDLPLHTHVRVNSKYMFIDSWDGESGYLKLDGNVVWTEAYNHNDGEQHKGFNICGNETPERKFGRQIDVTIPHTGNSIELTFGATTDEHPCDESFGVDSVMVFVR